MEGVVALVSDKVVASADFEPVLAHRAALLQPDRLVLKLRHCLFQAELLVLALKTRLENRFASGQNVVLHSQHVEQVAHTALHVLERHFIQVLSEKLLTSLT